MKTLRKLWNSDKERVTETLRLRANSVGEALKLRVAETAVYAGRRSGKLPRQKVVRVLLR